MKKRKKKMREKTGLALVEEGLYRLRNAPLSYSLIYFFGTAPFVLGLLFYWTDMSRGAFAEERCVSGALMLTGLYLWMKTWQTVFLVRFKNFCQGETDAPWTFRRWIRAAAIHAIIQPWSLLLTPFAVLLMIPYPIVHSFFVSAQLYAGDPEKTIGETIRDARKHAMRDPSQNHTIIFFLTLFGVAILINVVSVTVLIPFLLKILFGVHSPFTLSFWSFLNSSYIAMVLGLTFLCLDPISKAAYTLRHFEMESWNDGRDLVAAFRRLTPGTARRFALVAIAALGLFAATPSAPAQAEAVSDLISAQDLDEAIQDVMDQPEYLWRLPREQEARDDDQSALDRFFASLERSIKRGFDALADWMDQWEQWLDQLFGGKAVKAQGVDVSSLRGLLTVAIVAVVILALYLLYRFFRRRPDPELAIAPRTTAVRPDIEDESVGAERLPTDEWLEMARELLESGEYRLASRALFLAGLAYLAQREYIRLARFKSNREYLRELDRRAHALGDLHEAFGEVILQFEGFWYGRHAIDREIAEAFQEKVERMRRYAG